MSSLVDFNNRSVFITKSEKITGHSILVHINPKNGRNSGKSILVDSLPNYLKNIKNTEGQNQEISYILTPINFYQIISDDESINITSIDSYSRIDPIIQYYWFIRRKSEIEQYEPIFSNFLENYPVLESYITIKEFSLFSSYFLSKYFDLIPNKNSNDRAVIDLDVNNSRNFDKVYFPHLMYTTIQPQSSPSIMKNVYRQFADIKYELVDYSFIFYLKELSKISADLVFHHVPDLYNYLGFIEIAFRKIPNIKFGILVLSRAIDIELNNFYPSLNIALYFTSMRNFLYFDKSRRNDGIYHIQIAYRKMLDYLYRFSPKTHISPNEIEAVISIFNNIKISIDRETNNFLTLEEFYTSLIQVMRQFEEKLTVVHLTDLIYLSYNIEYQEINEYINLTSLWSQIAEQGIIIPIEIDDGVLDSAKLLHLIEYIVYYLQHYSIDECSWFHEIIFDLKFYYQSTVKVFDEKIIVNLFNRFRFLAIFDHLIEIIQILSSQISPQMKLSTIIDLLQSNEDRISVINVVDGIIMQFIAKNFKVIGPTIIRDYLSYQDSSAEIYTVNTLIHHLLLHLLGDRDLSPTDYEFMKKYLDLDDDLLDDNTSDGISELIFNLNQLKEKPTVVVDNDNGTLSELTFSQQSEPQGHDPSDPNLPLPYLPAPIFDLFDDDDENFDHYLKLFFRYHRIIQDLAQDSEANPERLYYELLEVDPEKQLVDSYFTKLTVLRKEHPQVVDDILVEILTIELILREFPSFTIPRLTNLKIKMLGRDVDPITWFHFFQLSLSVYIKLDLPEEVANTQLSLDLLDIYKGLNPLITGDLPAVAKYLHLTDQLTPVLTKTISEYTNLTDMVTAVVSLSTNSLSQLITTVLDPLVEFMIQIHLSWQSVTELEKINEMYSQSNILVILEELERASIVSLYQWSQGLLIHPAMFNIRLLELQQNDSSQAFLTRLQKEFTIIPEKQRAVWASLQTLLEKYDNISSQTDKQNLLDLI